LQNLIENPSDVNTIVGLHERQPPEKADAGSLFMHGFDVVLTPPLFFLKLFTVLYKVLSTPQFPVVTDSGRCWGLPPIQ
jgi:hypothetical protein